MFKCEICGREFETNRKLAFHIPGQHKIKTEEYYLKFIGEKGKCKECGKDTKFVGLQSRYLTFCSIKCRSANLEIKQKYKNTCMKNSGYENPMQNPEVKKRSKCTCMKNLNVENPMQSEKVKNKSKDTCMKNLNVENPMQSEKVKNKSRDTCVKKYNVDHYTKTREFKERYKNTCNERYNVDNYFKTKEFLIKSKDTCMKKYDVENAMQSKKIQNKHKKTCMKNLNVENPSQNKEIINKIQASILRNNNGIHHKKLTYQQCQERYPDVIKIEGLIEGPNGKIMGHCKNFNCKNSEENGGYFEVTSSQIHLRNSGINGHDTYYLYCCEECKKACPLYKRSAAALHNLMNENKEILYTQEEYNTWHEEVLYRQRIENNTDTNFCENCNSTENLHVHHEVPQKIVPGYALDPDNGIIFCEKCHYEKGHAAGTECSSGNLANKICK